MKWNEVTSGQRRGFFWRTYTQFWTYLQIMEHTPGYSCLNSIPNKTVMLVVMLYVLSVHQLLLCYELSFNYLRSIITSFLWLLPRMILNITGDLWYLTISPNKNTPLVSDRRNLSGYTLPKKPSQSLTDRIRFLLKYYW